MTEIHTYRCDVCGKEFAFEDECRKHEMKCKTAGLTKSPSKQAGRLFVGAKSRVSIYRTKPPKISLKFCAF